jgi:hypothetical protein
MVAFGRRYLLSFIPVGLFARLMVRILHVPKTRYALVFLEAHHRQTCAWLTVYRHRARGVTLLICCVLTG